MTKQLNTKQLAILTERATADYAKLTSMGLTTGKTFYPPGTQVMDASVNQARQDFEALSDAKEGLAQLAQAVLDEDRQDWPAKFGYGYGDDTSYIAPSVLGGLSIDGGANNGAKLAPTDRTMQQIITKAPHNFQGPASDIRAWWGIAPIHDVVLRTRRMPEIRKNAYISADRECYAMVSPGYKPYDLDAAANDLISVCPQGSRSRVQYDGQRAKVDIILANPHYLPGPNGGTSAAGVGETHRVVLRMKTSDDGSGGYHLQLCAERIRCINLTILHAKKSLLSGTHRRSDLRDLATEAIDLVQPTLEAFAEQWQGAWNSYYTDTYTKADIGGEESLKRIVASGRFRISGLGEDGTLAAVLKAMAEEPGDTRAHVHNALTRAAHTAPVTWSTRWADEDAEEMASKLLYQHVRLAPVMQDEISV